MLTAIELHAPGAFDPDQFACWSLRRPCGGQGERRRHIGLVPVELSTERKHDSESSRRAASGTLRYTGPPRPGPLLNRPRGDKCTSSFDAGHQFHLMEVIRTKFARPGQPNGPQVILLSHDTLLEKLFNKNANNADWQHVRLEGTARTAVLPQSNAGNRVRDATVRFLNAGQVEDGALRLRQYLEYKLLEVIGRVNIPVPVDFALDDTKKQVQAALDAIQSAVALHLAANQLVLTAQQQAGLQAHVASITGNFLAHYATGSTQAFSGSSLLGVVNAIDAYAECFMYEDPPGSGQLRYNRSQSRR
jgi:hypothetical protein